MTKFIHHRNHRHVDGLEPPAFGLYVLDVKGGQTIAYTCEDNVIKFAVAKCSSRDNFCRKTGRIIAEGRLNSAKHIREVIKQENETEYEAINRVL